MRNKIWYYTGWVIVVTGIMLLLITIFGRWTNIGGYQNSSPRSWERFDQKLVNRTSTFQSLRLEAMARAQNLLTELPPDEVMEILYSVVVDRFTNYDAQHTIFTNWIFWMLGKVYPAFKHILNVTTLVSKGHSLLCDQSSYVLVKLATEAGIRARHVGLYGHVVMEAWYYGDWHLYDPDMEVIPKDEKGMVLSVEALSKNEDLLHKFYGGEKRGVKNTITTRENNTFMSYPIGSRFEWKTQALSIFEKVMHYFAFILPLLFGVGGGVMIVKYRGVFDKGH